MFITGPDVIKTVTHEEVTKEELGGALAHNQKSGVAHFAAENEQAAHRAHPRAALVPALEQRTRTRRVAALRRRPVPRRGARSRRIVPSNPNKPYDIKEIIRAVVDDKHFFEVQEHYAKNIVVGFARINGRPVGIVANQPAVLAGCLDIDAEREGRALRALLRLLQHPARHLRRRARLPARHRPGVRRHHHARRQAALRVRRGHRAEGHGHHAQGLRRRLRRHGVQAHPRRHQLRLPHRGDRGDGPRGRGEHHLPQRAAEGAGRRRRAHEARRTSTARSSPTRTRRRSSATSTRSSAPRRPAPSSSARSRCSRTSARRTRRASTATSRL